MVINPPRRAALAGAYTPRTRQRHALYKFVPIDLVFAGESNRGEHREELALTGPAESTIDAQTRGTDRPSIGRSLASRRPRSDSFSMDFLLCSLACPGIRQRRGVYKGRQKGCIRQICNARTELANVGHSQVRTRKGLCGCAASPRYPGHSGYVHLLLATDSAGSGKCERRFQTSVRLQCSAAISAPSSSPRAIR